MSTRDTQKGHGRLTSTDERRRVAITRRPTLGPLDDGADDPLAAAPPGQTTLSTRTPPPRQARSPQPPPSRASRVATPTLSDVPPKDLSFLLDPAIFHPIPTNNIPQPFLTSPNAGNLQTPLETLLSNGQYRLAAQSCARELSETRDSTVADRILTLFHTRLACLTLLSHHDLAAQESKALGDLTSSFYRHPISGEHLLPWSLRVLCVRLTAIGYGEWRKGIMGYYELAREARDQLRKQANQPTDNNWSSRLEELGILTANLLIEMGDFECAAEHLRTLSRGDASEEHTARLRTMEAYIWLRVGDVAAASTCLSDLPDPDPILSALLQMANDDFEGAIDTWTTLNSTQPNNPVVAQNLAVCLLYQGRLTNGRDHLEGLVGEGHSFNSLIFNLATIYELSTEKARDRKVQLAEQIAGQTPRAATAWERTNASFKL